MYKKYHTSSLFFRITGLTDSTDRSLLVKLEVRPFHSAREEPADFYTETVDLNNRKACKAFAQNYEASGGLIAFLVLINLKLLTKELRKEQQRMRREQKNRKKFQKKQMQLIQCKEETMKHLLSESIITSIVRRVIYAVPGNIGTVGMSCKYWCENTQQQMKHLS